METDLDPISLGLKHNREGRPYLPGPQWSYEAQLIYTHVFRTGHEACNCLVITQAGRAFRISTGYVKTRVRIPSTAQQCYEADCGDCVWVNLGAGSHQAAREHAKTNPGHNVSVVSTVVTVYRAEVTA